MKAEGRPETASAYPPFLGEPGPNSPCFAVERLEGRVFLCICSLGAIDPPDRDEAGPHHYLDSPWRSMTWRNPQ